MGGEDRDIHFDTMTYGQGASMALPVWAYYMQKIYRDKTLGYSTSVPFDIPADFSPCGNYSGETDETEGEGTGETSIDEIFE